jgi:hypothetical protein
MTIDHLIDPHTKEPFVVVTPEAGDNPMAVVATAKTMEGLHIVMTSGFGDSRTLDCIEVHPRRGLALPVLH